MIHHLSPFLLINYPIMTTVNILILNSISVAMVYAHVSDQNYYSLINHIPKSIYVYEQNKSLSTRYNNKTEQEKLLNLSYASSLNILGKEKENIPKQKLSRAKRYVAFPEGSSFTTSVCITVGIIGNPRYDYMSFGLNWGVAYDLPNATWILDRMKDFKRWRTPSGAEQYQRRSRRSLFQEIERAFNNMGYNGRNCMLRFLCESRHGFNEFKMSMIGEMLRLILTLPRSAHKVMDDKVLLTYDRAFRPKVQNCADDYNCSLSLMELVFGRMHHNGNYMNTM